MPTNGRLPWIVDCLTFSKNKGSSTHTNKTTQLLNRTINRAMMDQLAKTMNMMLGTRLTHGKRKAEAEVGQKKIR